MSQSSAYYWTSFATATPEAIEEDVRRGGIKNERVIHAARQVRPGDFRPWDFLPRPALAAGIAEALQPSDTDTVLEIGTGTGYLTAILAALAGRVITFEINPRMAAFARASLSELVNHKKVELYERDGTLGYPEAAPYNCICVSGSVHAIPPALLDQLADGGRLFVPLGEQFQLVTRKSDAFTTKVLGNGRLSALQGSYGVSGESSSSQG